MTEEKTGFEVSHLRPKGNMPLSLASEWILCMSLEIGEEDLIEMDFH
jgi:hypothetical protein